MALAELHNSIVRHRAELEARQTQMVEKLSREFVASIPLEKKIEILRKARQEVLLDIAR